MKKIVFAISISMVIAMCHGANWSTNGFSYAEAQLLERVHEFSEGYATNKVLWVNWRVALENKTLAARIDENLIATPPSAFVHWKFREDFPLSHAAALSASELEYPAVVSAIRSHSCYKDFVNDPATTVSDKIGYTLMKMDLCGVQAKADINFVEENIKKLSIRNVRRKLREEGKSIVTLPDGRNPVQERLDSVASALNAPMFSGLGPAIKACGIDIYVPEKFHSAWRDGTLSKLMDSVYYGDVEFNDFYQANIRFSLGTEEYNKFVSRYNGSVK